MSIHVSLAQRQNTWQKGGSFRGGSRGGGGGGGGGGFNRDGGRGGGGGFNRDGNYKEKNSFQTMSSKLLLIFAYFSGGGGGGGRSDDRRGQSNNSGTVKNFDQLFLNSKVQQIFCFTFDFFL